MFVQEELVAFLPLFQENYSHRLKMKISVDDQEIFTLSEVEKKIIQNEIPIEIFEDDMRRRMGWWILDEKVNRCFYRLKNEWEPKLAARGIEMIPTSRDAFAQLVFSQPDYRNRSQKDLEAQSP